jgi:hypothetical protein
MDERRRRQPPHLVLCPGIFEYVARPNHFAGRGDQAVQFPGCAHGVDSALMKCGRGTRPGPGHRLFEAGFVDVDPDLGARIGVVADNCFVLVALLLREESIADDGHR